MPRFSGETFTQRMRCWPRMLLATYIRALNVAGLDYRSHQCIGQGLFQQPLAFGNSYARPSLI